MRLITISGLDGSGKSTQINLMKGHLESLGSKVFYFHAVDFSLAKKIARLKRYCLICRLLGKCRVESKEKSVTRANAFQIWLRKIFFYLDICRFDALRKKLEKEKYDYILSDRFFYDSAVNISYLERAKNNKIFPSKDWIPAPDLAIYLDASPGVIMSRERKPDQGLQYLEDKKNIYDDFYGFWKLKKIDGDRRKEEIMEDIKSLLNHP